MQQNSRNDWVLFYLKLSVTINRPETISLNKESDGITSNNLKICVQEYIPVKLLLLHLENN